MRAVTLPNVSYPLQKGENLSKFPIADDSLRAAAYDRLDG